jgi:hypothetical protein
MNAITKSFTGRKRIRKSFGRLPEIAPMPNLIDVQRSSYEAFLQMEVSPDSRTHTGLQEVFKSVFPIDDFAGRGRLEFVQYELEEPKYDVEECIQRGLTFAAPLKVRLRLIVWDVDEDTGSRSVRDIKEQDVYMGDMPLMTDNGTFIINGTERVIVSQMHRSPGVFFDHDKGKTHSSGKYLFAARVIPYRGSWLDFEFDAKDICYVRIDRKRKLPTTTLLLALDSARTEGLRAKAAAEIAVASWRASFAAELPPLATARAGNVIGGGDFAEARIIPDLVRAEMAGQPLLVRRPDATRPFQHVADVLRGYLMQAEHLAAGISPPALNFGPRDGEIRVRDLLAAWGYGSWRQEAGPVMAEAPRLALDSSLAGRAIGWQPLLDTPRAIATTAAWYAAWRNGSEMARATDAEIAALLPALVAA